jgi:hypothetical protein
MILHGIYDNGRIIFIEKNLPKIKANVKINFIEKIKFKKQVIKNNRISELKGIWKYRNDIEDSSEWVRSLRNLSDKRLK